MRRTPRHFVSCGRISFGCWKLQESYKMEAEYMPAFKMLGNTFRALPTQSCTIEELDMARGAKGTTQRAPKIPAETLKRLKPIICEEYMTKTLEELVKFLKVEHDLIVKYVFSSKSDLVLILLANANLSIGWASGDVRSTMVIRISRIVMA